MGLGSTAHEGFAPRFRPVAALVTQARLAVGGWRDVLGQPVVPRVGLPGGPAVRDQLDQMGVLHASIVKA
jgi:hypothetical protein